MDDKPLWKSRRAKRPLGKQDQKQGRDELGYITILVLILFAMFSAYGLEMYVKAHSENKIARREVSSRQAFYGAEGGIEWLKVKLKEDPSFTGGSITIGEGMVNAHVLAHPRGYTVTTHSQYGLVNRKLVAELVKVNGQLIITKYQEIDNE